MIGAVAGVQILGNWYSQKQQAAYAQAQMEAQAKAAFKNMNYAFQNYEQERIDAYDSTVNELIRTKQNSMSLNSAVKAAVLEQGGDGRTARLLIRTTEGDTNKALTSMKDNYTRKSNEVDLNKDSALKSTESQLKAINMSAPQMPSAFSNFLSTAGIVTSAVTSMNNVTSNPNRAKGDNAPSGKSPLQNIYG